MPNWLIRMLAAAGGDWTQPPRQSAAEIDTLRDLAFSLEPESPFEAYALYRLILKSRPGAPVVRARYEALKACTHDDWIVAWRPDGLCERLYSILIGQCITSACALQFRFLWPDMSVLATRFQITFGQGHSVPVDPAEILSPRFIDQHLITEEDILVPAGGLVGGNPGLRAFVLDRFDKLAASGDIARPCWLTPSRASDELIAAVGPGAFRSLFRTGLFNDRVMAHLDAIDQVTLPARRVALHVRGGDVIYNDARHTHTFGRIKTFSLPVAEALCDHFLAKGYSVILFGATRGDLEYLASRDADIRLASEFDPGTLDLVTEVIRDVWLMSGCETIVSAEDTAVTKLAARIGDATFVTHAEIIPPDVEYLVSSDLVASGRITDFDTLQQAFIHYATFVTAPADADLATLAKHAQSAHRCDPDNVQYLILCLLAAYALEDRLAAGAVSEKLAPLLPGSAADCFAALDFGVRYICFREASVQRLLTVIASDARVPEHVRALATVIR